MKNQKSIGHSAMLMANIFFGLNISISKDLLGGAIRPLELNAFRFLFGLVVFWVLSLFFREKVTRKDLGALFIGAIFGLFTNQIFFMQGLIRTSPIDASIISTSLPILTMLLSAMILKEPITWMKAFGVLLGASGAIFLIHSAQHEHTGKSNLLGDLLCLGSCLSFSFFLVITKPISQKYNPITTMKWMFLFASLLFIPFSFTEIAAFHPKDISQNSYGLLAFVLICGTFLPYLLIPVGQKSLRPTTIAMYNYVQPLMATLVAVYVGLDTFTFTKGIAAALVFLGVFVVTRSKSRADVEAEQAAKALLVESDKK